MTTTTITPGLYRHYKGNLYEVIGLARHSETLEELVVYRALYAGEFPFGQRWVRPKAMFAETIVFEGRTVPRFTRVEDAAAA